MGKLKTMLFGAAIGAAATYYLDPDRGNARRAQHRDQLIAKGREVSRDVEKQARYTEGRLQGARAEADGRGQLQPEDDHSIKQGVQQRIATLRIDLQDVVVDVTDGVVGLRGQVPSPEQKETVELAAAEVPGVRQVETWLHLPGQPAPNKAEARRAG